jgi:hypothetical protein
MVLFVIRTEAYIDYAYLKHLLKPFSKFKENYIFVAYEDDPTILISNTNLEYLE